MKLLCVAAMMWVGCASDDGGRDVGDVADVVDGVDADATAPGGMVSVDDPVAARDPLETKTCAVGRQVTKLTNVPYYIESLVRVGDRVLATVPIAEEQFGPGTLTLSELGLDGALGRNVELQDGGATSAVAGEASVAVAWVRNGDGSAGEIWFAQVDASDLSFLIAPKLLVPKTRVSQVSIPTLVDDGEGWMLMWAAPHGESTALTLQHVAADGTLEGDAVIVATDKPAGYGYAESLIVDGDGFAATWASGDYQTSEVWFARLDHDGVMRGEAHRISRASGDGYTSGQPYRVLGDVLRKVGDVYWAVFPETHAISDYPDPHSEGVVRLAVFDGDGKGTLYRMQAPRTDVVVEQPSLVALGDDVGVLWSEGSAIYICGGCMADYDAHLVLLDATTVRPAAAPVTAVHEGSNGFRSPHGIAVGDTLLLSVGLDFHALLPAGTGTIVCTPK